MMHLLYSFGIGIGGMVLIAVVWFAVQQFVRRNSPQIPEDCDLLEGMAHGCGNCSESGTCGTRHH
jgi:hypothetical protein